MKTMEIENVSVHECLHAILERFRTNMTVLCENTEKRDKENQRWIIGLVLAFAQVLFWPSSLSSKISLS
ncbi:MAG: hypothetical protein OXC62_01225 [Aestuariivita sp.]|nr:hypothetical protein [Aestuariivita sp.]